MSNNDNVRRERDAKLMARSVRGQLVMLLAQLLVGMAVNILGLPQGAKGAVRIETSLALGVHVLVAVGLLFGAITTVVRARGSMDSHRSMSVRALGAVVVAFAAGVLDLLTGSDWWSFLMAAAATAAIALYGVLFVRMFRTPPPSEGREPVHNQRGD